MARRARRPRGRIYRFKRGRWRALKRGYRRRYRKFRSRKLARRFRRNFRRAFHNPHPGAYTVRRPNPQTRMKVRFQGIIFVPEAVLIVPNKQDRNIDNCIYTHVGKIDLTFRKLLLATLPQDGVSKMGGPVPGNVKSFGMFINAENNWPHCWVPAENNQPSSTPNAWWRWALMLMHPVETARDNWATRVFQPYDMARLFGGWQLLRHARTTFQVFATQATGSFSPVASLLSQNSYLAGWDLDLPQHPFHKGRQPMCEGDVRMGVIGAPTTQTASENKWYAGGSTNQQYLTADSYYPPCDPIKDSKTPDKLWDAYQQWNDLRIGDTMPLRNSVECTYSTYTYMSFATLSALGAPWAFPPPQRMYSRKSINHHTARGNNDPQGERWLSLVPRGQIQPTKLDPFQNAKGIDTVVATLYLAQGTPASSPYKFMTYSENINHTAVGTRHWAVIKVKSEWELGNRLRPWRWDVHWYNTIGPGPKNN